MSDKPHILFRRRCLLLYLCFAVPVLLITFQLVRYTLLKRHESLHAARKIAWRKGQLPVLRGRILDRDGVVLAWTELQFDYVLKKLPRNPARRKALAEKIGCPVEQLKQDMVVESSVAPDQILAKKDDLRNYQEIRIVTRFVRHTLPDDCVLDSISDWEKEHEETLSGVSGEFLVMLDRRGSWLPETMKIIRAGVPGKDVTVDFSLKSHRETQHHE